jgi:hypothetical protein
MGLSGDEEALRRIDLHSFTKAFVAGLVSTNVDAVQPHDPRDRRGFARVVEILDDEVQKLLKAEADPDTVLPLAKLANELRASGTGGFEGFEAALRALQMTFTASPNAWHDDISFPVTAIDASSYFRSVPARTKALAMRAAEAFGQARSRTS